MADASVCTGYVLHINLLLCSVRGGAFVNRVKNKAIFMVSLDGCLIPSVISKAVPSFH